MTPPLYGRMQRGTKEPLDEVQESEKAGLKLNIKENWDHGISPITSWQIEREKVEAVTDFLFLDSKSTVDGDCSHEIKTFASWKKNYDKPRQHIKKQRHYFAKNVHLVKAMVFSSSHAWMWELDHKESWGPNNWCFWTVVLKKTLESPLDSKKIKTVNPEENQSWIFIERTDAEAEAPIVWLLDERNWLIRKDPDAGKNWR